MEQLSLNYTWKSLSFLLTTYIKVKSTKCCCSGWDKIFSTRSRFDCRAAAARTLSFSFQRGADSDKRPTAVVREPLCHTRVNIRGQMVLCWRRHQTPAQTLQSTKPICIHFLAIDIQPLKSISIKFIHLRKK